MRFWSWIRGQRNVYLFRVLGDTGFLYIAELAKSDFGWRSEFFQCFSEMTALIRGSAYVILASCLPRCTKMQNPL